MFLVTGGAGFIGSNILASLEASGYRDLVCCDRLGTAEKWKNIAKRDLSDLISPDQLPTFLDAQGHRLSAVIHMGALSATTETDADRIKQENIDLTLALWRWCADEQVRLIYASSAATYGDGAQGFDDDPSPEAMARLVPLNAYGWSKHHTDRRIQRVIRDGGNAPPQWVGLKFFNVYGPNEYHKGAQQSVVPQFHRQIKESGEVKLFRSHKSGVGDGDQARDFVFVEDGCRLVTWLLGRGDVNGLFNVGSGQARTFLDVAHAVFAAMGREPSVTFIDTPETIRDGYQYFTQASLSRLRTAGFDQPMTTLEDGVGDYVRSYLEADDPYR
ncbi:MAG: ADP-glyceromanno-heptose 6-epimerase [Geminicoccaceae bacterium]